MTAEQTDIENAEAGTAGRSGPNFQPIKAKRAFEAVCEQIRREVALGTLKPGDRLPPEREFAEQLGVSRTAVREAMRSLENAGIVQCQQGMGGGAFIRKRDSSTVTQAVGDMVMLGQIPSHSVTEMRIILTEQAIRLACERATEEDFQAIEQDIDRAEELTLRGDFSRRNAYITEFYRILAQATHNQVMVMLVESLSELTRALLAKASPVPRSDVIGVRRNVLRLMRARDAEGAVKEMRAHLERLNRLLEKPATEG
ncbi:MULTISPECIES: FadR/GntR family transcriptional regulator [unclassified Variovorax]|jgi:GntR family transcriptional repressor for pyruvate dehydrogenase complex|uniref:FadR/GntR family transcriptional regulator n=1 Tax=unclassified Variovorax TaxID=663243 RepID=UPI000C5FAED7|nr:MULTISPECIES: FCD domain-containing protein [unclassified Variovorax]MBS76812.1 GntR family transcriptional regulator [Variovorax sp.]MCT8178938.1 FCD domain-containing protein [Variovorax sp. CY25R-8]